MSECLNIDLQERLPEYLAEQLDAGTAMSVRRHLMGCSVCREDLAILARVRGVQPLVPAMDIQRIGQALSAVAPVHLSRHPAAPEGLASPPSMAVPVSRLRKARVAPWKMAASFALLLVGGSSVYLVQGGEVRLAADSLRGGASVGDVRSSIGRGRVQGSQVAEARVSISYGDLGDYSATELEQMLTRLEAWDGNTSPEPLPMISMVSTQGGREP
jgi:hypothetical protein